MAEEKNTPFAVRMDADVKAKLMKMIEESGADSNKEFMNTLMAAYELNRVKVEVPEAVESIRKVEELTQLINDNFVNMSKHIKITKESMNLQFTKDIEVYKERLESIKAENTELESKFSTLQDAYNNSCTDIEELKKELGSKDKLVEQLQESVKDKTVLVEEYKEKNDMLLGQMKQYEKYPEQIEEHKKSIEDLHEKVTELTSTIKDKDWKIDNITEQNENLKANIDGLILDYEKKIKDASEAATKTAEFDRDKSILELKTKHQQEQQDLQNKHNEEIKQYQDKYKELLQEVEHVKAASTRTKKQPNKSAE